MDTNKASQEYERIAVVIPCFSVKKTIANVITNIGSNVSDIFVVDDACPEASGSFIESNCTDSRVTVLYHDINKGVGAATMTGYQAAINANCKIIVKVDGDGQMDPNQISNLVTPIINGEADYTKGNRFFDLEQIYKMPKARLFGNTVLSFMTKLSSGYWNIFDPTNGFTAIHASVAQTLPFNKISNRYFFETDILFRLNTLRAVVMDIPMDASYGEEVSNLQIKNVIGEFIIKHIRNFTKRIFYNYYLRDMSLASIELPLGISLMVFGFTFGLYHWIQSYELNLASTTGTVMLAVLPILIGFQLILSFLNYDISNVPNRPYHVSISLTHKP